MVNANSERVRQLQTRGATLTLPGTGIPALRADLALEPPYRFRMRAELLAFTGPEVDFGGNEELFWFWTRSSQPPAVYYVRRDQFAVSATPNVMPVAPDWLAEAIGLARLDPAGIHEGPFPRGPGRLEVRSRIHTSAGEMMKISLIDETYGWLLEQHLYGPDGRVLASSQASQHRFYPEVGVSLPHHVELRMSSPQASQPLSFQLDVSSYLANQLQADPAQLWAMPRLAGYPLVDLADPLPGGLAEVRAGGCAATGAKNRAHRRAASLSAAVSRLHDGPLDRRRVGARSTHLRSRSTEHWADGVFRHAYRRADLVVAPTLQMIQPDDRRLGALQTIQEPLDLLAVADPRFRRRGSPGFDRRGFRAFGQAG